MSSNDSFFEDFEIKYLFAKSTTYRNVTALCGVAEKANEMFLVAFVHIEEYNRCI